VTIVETVWNYDKQREFADEVQARITAREDAGYVLAAPPVLAMAGANSTQFGTILTFVKRTL
jgi:hypothetical protein